MILLTVAELEWPADRAAGGARLAPAFRADAGVAVIAGLASGDVVLVRAWGGLALGTVADDILAAVPPRPGPEATS